MPVKYFSYSLLILLSFLVFYCQDASSLPVLGPYERVAGEKVFHPVRDFNLLNQENEIVTSASFKNKVRVVDFFFISCPSICPKVQAQMLRIHEAFAEQEKVVLLSHTVDPKRDSVTALAHYAYQLGIEDADKWQFLTGEKDLLYQLADDHFNIVVEDQSAPGGFDHTGRIVLIDQDGFIRSYGNGLDPYSIDTLIQDIRQLVHLSPP